VASGELSIGPDAVIDGAQSRVFPEAENRLHTCKAVMALTM
jgi:ornithine carbamoyltransferase